MASEAADKPLLVFQGKAESADLKELNAVGLFRIIQCTRTAEAISLVNEHKPSVFACKLGTTPETLGLAAIEELRPLHRSMFIMVMSVTACERGSHRIAAFEAGANMVTSPADRFGIMSALSAIHKHLSNPGTLNCPYCGAERLTSDNLWEHMPLYHIYKKAPIASIRCPVESCGGRRVKEFQVHMHNHHRPAHAGPPEERNPHALHGFALTVVRRPTDGKYLLCQEFAGQGFWLPGGRMDAGEDFKRAAIRECAEEAGVDIRLTGVLAIEQQAKVYERDGEKEAFQRMRMIFLAEPVDPSVPAKTLPDFESAGAAWLAPFEILAGDLPFRGPEPQHWVHHLESGGDVAPMSIVSSEHHYHSSYPLPARLADRSTELGRAGGAAAGAAASAAAGAGTRS